MNFFKKLLLSLAIGVLPVCVETVHAMESEAFNAFRDQHLTAFFKLVASQAKTTPVYKDFILKLFSVLGRVVTDDVRGYDQRLVQIQVQSMIVDRAMWFRKQMPAINNWERISSEFICQIVEGYMSDFTEAEFIEHFHQRFHENALIKEALVFDIATLIKSMVDELMTIKEDKKKTELFSGLNDMLVDLQEAYKNYTNYIFQAEYEIFQKTISDFYDTSLKTFRLMKKVVKKYARDCNSDDYLSELKIDKHDEVRSIKDLVTHLLDELKKVD